MRIASRIVVLVALWLLAWGEASLANVVTGAAAAAAILVVFPPSPRAGDGVRLDPAGMARLAGYVLVQLVTSNVLMTRRILGRRADIAGGVLEHRVTAPSEQLITLMTTVIALSPGTMTVDVDDDSTTISIHYLLLRDVAATRASVARLEELAMDAIHRGRRRAARTPPEAR